MSLEKPLLLIQHLSVKILNMDYNSIIWRNKIRNSGNSGASHKGQNSQPSMQRCYNRQKNQGIEESFPYFPRCLKGMHLIWVHFSPTITKGKEKTPWLLDVGPFFYFLHLATNHLSPCPVKQTKKNAVHFLSSLSLKYKVPPWYCLQWIQAVTSQVSFTAGEFKHSYPRLAQNLHIL